MARRSGHRNPSLGDYLSAGKRAAASAVAAAADAAKGHIEAAKAAAEAEARRVTVRPITEEQAIRTLAQTHGLIISNPRLPPDMLIHAGHGIQKRGSRYVVQPYGRDFGTLAAAKRWVEKHVRREMTEPTPNPRRTLPPKPLDLYDLNGTALLQVVDRLGPKAAKQYRDSRERGSSVRVAALAAIEAAYARQNATRKNPSTPYVASQLRASARSTHGDFGHGARDYYIVSLSAPYHHDKRLRWGVEGQGATWEEAFDRMLADGHYRLPLAAVKAAQRAIREQQRAPRNNPRQLKNLSGGEVMSLVPAAYKGRMTYGKNFCASDNLQPWETDAIVERLAKEGCVPAVTHNMAPARGLREYRTVIHVFPTVRR